MAKTEIDDVAELLAHSEKASTPLPSTAAIAEDAISRDRTFISRNVTLIYVAVIGGCGLFLWYRAYTTGANVFGDFAELIKIGVIPVVMAVVGFYYGISKGR